ncbi:MAG: DUF3570 domain-containing protein [Acidobacteria bacterium]|nr:MAG: DUF3570 domain-containing protein [Acidobacteriota bacterium]MCE7957907.1 DUF3570 domain-containing protein [Acidobacteria bacterium ACB2]MDL1877625.1 DUF3570 domain-containing protein [Cytophagia bacterium CHB2]
MAATERPSGSPPAAPSPRRSSRRKPRRRGAGALGKLPVLAAGLGALAARKAQGQSSIDARFLFYKESDGRTQVMNPWLGIHQELGPTLGNLDLLLAYDSISGASPTGAFPSLDVTTSASGNVVASGSFPTAEYSDKRTFASLAWSKKLGAHLPSVDLSYGKENDYEARSFGLSDSWTLLGGRGTLHAGFSYSSDLVEPVTNDLSLSKRSAGYALGWTWVLGERDLLDVSGSWTSLSGYLDDPYKVVPVGPDGSTQTLPDRRPDSRSRLALVARYGHSFGSRSALKLTYRYYRDDWQVSAHTLEAAYDQRLFGKWVVTPEVRLYTQSAASFYGARFPVEQPYMSSDYRLSSLWNALGGLTVGREIDDRFGIRLGGTYQYQKGRDRITLSGTGEAGEEGTAAVSAADMKVFTVTLGFTFKY